MTDPADAETESTDTTETTEPTETSQAHHDDAAADPDDGREPRTRRRSRRRTRTTTSAETAEPDAATTPDDDAAADRGRGGGAGDGDQPGSSGEAAEATATADAEEPATAEEAPATEAEESSSDAEEAADRAETDDAGSRTDSDEAPRIRRRRRGRRGGRGRGRGGRDRPSQTDDAEESREPTTQEPGDAAGAADPQDEVDSAPATEDTATAPTTDDREGDASQQTSTRLRSKQRGRGRGRPGRRPISGVSEETRRAINEGPPRRMLVTVGRERTQIAVLEQRTLVEHFVTRKADESIVGNIYLGRVQNVLPGMEAAFVDIGQGRNGVLYAGEVDYPTDTDDLEQDGELPRIEQTLKPGQTVLVQVTKDAMGSKGARLTQHLSLAGRFCVLAPNGGMLGISRKLPDEERQRLRSILSDIVPEGFGVIVRTAAEGTTREQLEADVARLTRIWDTVSAKADKAEPLEPVYEEPGLVMRVIRDVYGPEYIQLIIDDADLAEQIRDYLGDVAPDLARQVEVHAGDEPLFDAYEVTVQVRRALEKKVWLRSGGYLIIEKTEAMWIIDVNTGKFVGSDNLEETVLRNNLEAAEEIARQLRLRDMGGIIVIDFVDMLVPANRDEVLKRFKRELARDKTKSRVMDISRLGLVQMTRKNVSQGLTETFTERCEACEGRGAVITDVFS